MPDPLSPASSPAVRSFYHLGDQAISEAVCRGTACFAARHRDPALWESGCAQNARSYCLGKCYAGPATGRDETRPRMEVHASRAVVMERLVAGGARSLSAYRRSGGYGALEKARRLQPEGILGTIEASALRGRGGAGFPVGRKWRVAAGQPGPGKHIVANADEGDPGAYIDRFLMEDDPHRLLEAMAIAGHAVGAGKGVIYLRKEYPHARTVLEAALAEAAAAGALGAFAIELVAGHGGYVCGEETALLNAIEGRRPEVRVRPPHTAERGLFGKPTVVNNVETLASVPWILEHGAEAYRALGFSKSRGTKVVSLNSLFRRPGLYEVDFGVPVRRIVEEIGGGLKEGSLKGLLIGGPLAGILPRALLDTPLGFEELRAVGAGVGHGGVVAFDERTPIRDLVHQVLDYAAFESCGKCTPCRLGSRRLERLVGAGRLPKGEWEGIVSALGETSLCGLGTGLAEFLRSAARCYPGEFEACLAS